MLDTPPTPGHNQPEAIQLDSFYTMYDGCQGLLQRVPYDRSFRISGQECAKRLTWTNAIELSKSLKLKMRCPNHRRKAHLESKPWERCCNLLCRVCHEEARVTSPLGASWPLLFVVWNLLTSTMQQVCTELMFPSRQCVWLERWPPLSPGLVDGFRCKEQVVSQVALFSCDESRTQFGG